MILEEILYDEVLQQAAEKCAEAIIVSLQLPKNAITSFPNGSKKRCKHCSSQRPSAS